VQFELEESRTAAFLKNRTCIRGQTISVQPSKFAAVPTPVSVRQSNNNHHPLKDSLAGEENVHSVADKARFNPYLSSSGSARSESSTSHKRPKLRYNLI